VIPAPPHGDTPRVASPPRQSDMSTGLPGKQEAGIIGRTLRLMLAMLLGLMTYVAIRTENKAFSLHLLATFAAVAVFYMVAHLVVRRYRARLTRWSGAFLALIPLVLVFGFGGLVGRVAVAAYLGLSLLLQTLRGDSGSEVLAIPGALFRRPTHLAGILFAPIDLVEKHLTGPGGLPG
jgi:uncharacterized membrane protein YhaH (DUF805 family)